MKYKLLYLIPFLFLVVSCDFFPSNKTFWVYNHSKFSIDSLEISNGYSSIQWKELNIHDSVKLRINFDDNIKKLDGSYSIQVNAGKNNRFKSFGYFSNGVPTKGEIKVYITNDSIIIIGY